MGEMNGRSVPQQGEQKWYDGKLYEYNGPVGGWGVVNLSEKELADRLLHDQISGAPTIIKPGAPARKSSFFAASTLKGRQAPLRNWLAQDLIPSGTVTLLGGDGGTGKSLVALQLAVAVASGCQWLNRSVASGGALFISAEDDESELHRRVADVVDGSPISFDDLDNLTLRSLAGEDALLAQLDRGSGVLTPTDLFHELDLRLSIDPPALLVLDTLADLFPGNENDRTQARHFIGMLRGLAIRHDCAVLLLAHPSLSGLNSGSGTSGSTAWNNSVRSRLYLRRVLEDGIEIDPDMRILATMKSNHARIGNEITMKWRDGIFVANKNPDSLDRMAASAKAERVFLRLLDEFAKQGRFVKSAQAQGYAPKVFASSGGAEGLSKRDLHAAMERLFQKGEIIEVLGGHRSPSKQTKRIVRARNAAAEPASEGC